MAVTAGLGLTAMLLVGVGPVGAAPGDLDTTFSSDGKVTTDIGTTDAGRASPSSRTERSSSLALLRSAELTSSRWFDMELTERWIRPSHQMALRRSMSVQVMTARTP